MHIQWLGLAFFMFVSGMIFPTEKENQGGNAGRSMQKLARNIVWGKIPVSVISSMKKEELQQLKVELKKVDTGFRDFVVGGSVLGAICGASINVWMSNGTDILQVSSLCAMIGTGMGLIITSLPWRNKHDALSKVREALILDKFGDPKKRMPENHDPDKDNGER